uniref:TetR family transcriptional regulator n=1 Tax=Rhizobium leguminosarum TaxID=384 RepID=A0A154I7A3_RHILE|nr:hypothetical protein A4A59_35025 [Rhizobium leguminosarum]
MRIFFLSLRDHLTAILARGLPSEIAEELATDALVRIVGATLMTAVFDESDTMERAIQAAIRVATTASR